MKITRKIIDIVLIAVLLYLSAQVSTLGWNFFLPDIKVKPHDLELPERLQAHTRKLSQDIGRRSVFNYAGLEQAAEYIIRQLESSGYDVKLQEYFVIGKKTKNIIAAKSGAKFPEEIIVVGAHYDSYFNPGADDNASGVAAVLELAALLKNETVDRTIEFVFFANEEPPFFQRDDMGSRVFTKIAKESGRNIRAAIIFDMIGYYSNRINSQRYFPLGGVFSPNKANFIAVFADSEHRQFAERAVSYFRNSPSLFPIRALILDFQPSVDFSDHWSFWKENYPAIMVSDTVFLRYSNYHKDSDTWEKLNYQNMACVVEGFRSAIIGIADN